MGLFSKVERVARETFSNGETDSVVLATSLRAYLLMLASRLLPVAKGRSWPVSAVHVGQKSASCDLCWGGLTHKEAALATHILFERCHLRYHILLGIAFTILMVSARLLIRRAGQIHQLSYALSLYWFRKTGIVKT
ncbi:hypothetical protein AO063_14540 [Pseudomonas fluorescens ICMP 11288]|uniref:Uncharacterized protein n=1 Tax=Pseudomonas fluorescens ICMP 11288 TaxID=1198309 RepID=A0A0W0HP87_PSEFL|nr:hypothetical protein AO063_14540 [Pseudomonas fluorescens ICMP 11288]